MRQTHVTKRNGMLLETRQRDSEHNLNLELSQAKYSTWHSSTPMYMVHVLCTVNIGRVVVTFQLPSPLIDKVPSRANNVRTGATED